MNEIDRNYELNVLKIAIDKYLDETISVTDKDLKSLEANRDRVVWELVAKIYSQSGHKVEFCMVRDVVNSRIEVMKVHLAAEAEEVRWAEERIRIRSGKLGQDEIKVKKEVFVKFRKIVSEHLDVDENKVNFDSYLHDLDADDLDLIELVMAVEEEFEIEIPDREAEKNKKKHYHRVLGNERHEQK